MKLNNKFQYTGRIISILIGSFISAVSINGIIIPNNLLSGGVTGIAVLLFYITGLPAGIGVFLLNIPLVIIAFKFISKRFVFFSIMGIISSTIFLLITEGIRLPVNDPLLASVFGGIIMGAGGGLVLRKRGSMGGTDIVAVLINKFFSFTIGQITMTINVVIISAFALIFNLHLVLYTLILMFTAIKTIDVVQEGFNRRKTVIIVSDKSEEIGNKILKEVGRGVTYINGEGAFTKNNKKIIYCIVKTMELAKLKDVVRNVDNNAFMAINDTKEVLGKGMSIIDMF